MPTSITSGYGLRGARFHGRVDIVAGLDAPVGSPGSGEVVYAGWRDGGWGNAVMVAHGGECGHVHSRSGCGVRISTR